MNKRLLIVFICLAVLVLILVCGAIVFTVKDIDVLVAGDNVNIDKAEIVASSGIKKGVSIFTLDEQEIINNIEKAVPYAKVTDIERAFPNKVRISIEYRQAVVAVSVKNSDNFLILDANMKILEVTKNLNAYNVIKIDGLELELTDLGNVKGSFVNLEADKINTLFNTLLGLKEVSISGDRFIDFVDTISFVDRENYMLVGTSKGVNIVIRRYTNAKEDLQAMACYNKFNKLNDSQREDNSAYIYVKNNGNCVYSNDIQYN